MPLSAARAPRSGRRRKRSGTRRKSSGKTWGAASAPGGGASHPCETCGRGGAAAGRFKPGAVRPTHHFNGRRARAPGERALAYPQALLGPRTHLVAAAALALLQARRRRGPARRRATRRAPAPPRRCWPSRAGRRPAPPRRGPRSRRAAARPPAARASSRRGRRARRRTGRRPRARARPAAATARAARPATARSTASPVARDQVSLTWCRWSTSTAITISGVSGNGRASTALGRQRGVGQAGERVATAGGRRGDGVQHRQPRRGELPGPRAPEAFAATGSGHSRRMRCEREPAR